MLAIARTRFCTSANISETCGSEARGLQTQEVDDYLEVVLHAMMNLAQEQFSIPQRLLKALLRHFPFGNVPHHLGEASQVAGMIVEWGQDSAGAKDAAILADMS